MVERHECHCLKCGYRWFTKKVRAPMCPNCHRTSWDKEPKAVPPKEPPKYHYGANRPLIVAAYKRTPQLTLEEIGQEFGVSRQRVHQILQKEGVDTHHVTIRICSSCGKKLDSKPKSGLCRECGKKSTIATLTCVECGVTFPRKRALAKRKKSGGVFCSRHCHGIYVAKHFGFIAHPENAGRHDGGSSQYLHLIPEAVALAKEGCWLAEIGRRLNIERPIYRKEFLNVLRSQVVIPQKPRKDKKPRLSRRPFTHIPEILPKAIELYKRTKSLEKIAIELHIGHNSLYRYKDIIRQAVR